MVSPEAPDTSACSVCCQLADVEWATQKWGWEENDTFLPDAVGSLKPVRDLKPNSNRALKILQCPECGTHYLYRSDYEYLANGSEDEQELRRLTAEQAAGYLGQEPGDTRLPDNDP